MDLDRRHPWMLANHVPAYYSAFSLSFCQENQAHAYHSGVTLVAALRRAMHVGVQPHSASTEPRIQNGGISNDAYNVKGCFILPPGLSLLR